MSLFVLSFKYEMHLSVESVLIAKTLIELL